MSKFTNLPGIEVSIADGGLILPEDAATQSMLIIAPSAQVGAPQEPVLIRESAELATYGFGGFIGTDGKVNPIAGAWKAAFDGGCRQIYLMALNGTDEKTKFTYLQDKLFGLLADFTVDHIVAVGVYADADVATIAATDFVSAEDKANFPNAPGVITYGYVVRGTALQLPVTVTTTTADTIVINDGTTDKTITVDPKVYDGSTEAKGLTQLGTDLTAELVGAGLTNFKVVVENGQLVIIGDKAFTVKSGNLLAGLKLTAATASAKEQHSLGKVYAGSFAKLLGDYAASQTQNYGSTIAYIATKAPASNTLTTVKTYVDALLARSNEYSGYVQVTGGSVFGYQIPNYNGVFYTDGDLHLTPVSYAALASGLRPESATTNKPVAGVAALWYQLSLRQLNALTGKKYVTFRVKNNRVIVTDGVTSAPDLLIGGQKRSSDFTRLSTLRITQAAVQLVRETSEPFIGEANRMPQYNAMNAAIKGALEAMKTQGAIMDYRFSIVARGSTLNEAKITLDIVPAFELRKISIDVALRPQF